LAWRWITLFRRAKPAIRSGSLRSRELRLVVIDEATMAEVGRKLPAMRWPFPVRFSPDLIAALDRAGAEKS